jgi:hypothetical protein
MAEQLGDRTLSPSSKRGGGCIEDYQCCPQESRGDAFGTTRMMALDERIACGVRKDLALGNGYI